MLSLAIEVRDLEVKVQIRFVSFLIRLRHQISCGRFIPGGIWNEPQLPDLRNQ